MTMLSARTRVALHRGILAILLLSPLVLVTWWFLSEKLPRPEAGHVLGERGLLLVAMIGVLYGIQNYVWPPEMSFFRGALKANKGDLMPLGLLAGIFACGLFVTPQENGPTDPGIGEVVEVEGPTLGEDRFDLRDWRGKVVAVDFWATWCGPCVAELPNLRATYDRYHDQGFEVVAVSLDFERDALVTFLETHPEPWPQIFFDEEGRRGFDNPLAKNHGVRAIPKLLLVDRDGRLVARGLQGQQFTAAVAEELGLSPPRSERPPALGWVVFYGLLRGIHGSTWLFVVSGFTGALLVMGLEHRIRRLLATRSA